MPSKHSNELHNPLRVALQVIEVSLKPTSFDSKIKEEICKKIVKKKINKFSIYFSNNKYLLWFQSNARINAYIFTTSIARMYHKSMILNKIVEIRSLMTKWIR